MTSEELLRQRERRDILRAVEASLATLFGGSLSVVAAAAMRWPVHWATLTIVVLGFLFVASTPLLIDVFDHSFKGAVIRQDLSFLAEQLFATLYERAKPPSITVWSSPEASHEGPNCIWLANTMHLAVRNDLDVMPDSARSFVIARAVDSAVSSRGIGWSRLTRAVHWLPFAAALLLSAYFGEWVLLGSCLWVFVPMIVFLVWHKVNYSTGGASNRFEKRHLATDQRAVWASGGMSGARAWYTNRLENTEGHAREMLRQRLADLERTE